VYLRIPGWSRKTKVTLNGKPAQRSVQPNEYFVIKREWKPGDTIRVEFDMNPQLVVANPRVREDLGRVAVQRGPLLYCLEQLDQAGRESVFDVSLLLGAEPAKEFTSQVRPEMLGGITVLQHKGIATPKPLSKQPLYESLERPSLPAGNEVDLTFIPYYAWANRLPGPMEVWIPYTSAAPKTPPRRKTSSETNSP
jgi:hypothetical protein